MDKGRNIFDLEERTAKFAEKIIELCKNIKITVITEPIVKQLIRAGTSVGANYCEANNASSRKDFKNKIFICKKETRETRYWIRVLKRSINYSHDEILPLEKESHELNLIFQKIITSLEKNK